MTRLETPFVFDGDLIIVEACVTGPRAPVTGRFVLDTGAVLTTIIPEIADLAGYSARDGFRRATIHTAVGQEHGYWLRVAGLQVLGLKMSNFALQVFDLGHNEIHGLIGMNLLVELNLEIRPAEQRLLVERVANIGS